MMSGRSTLHHQQPQAQLQHSPEQVSTLWGELSPEITREPLLSGKLQKVTCHDAKLIMQDLSELSTVSYRLRNRNI